MEVSETAHRMPPAVRVGRDIEAMFDWGSTGTTYWLEIRVALVTGHPSYGVPIRPHEEGLILARQIMRLLPPAQAREAERAISAALGSCGGGPHGGRRGARPPRG